MRPMSPPTTSYQPAAPPRQEAVAHERQGHGCEVLAIGQAGAPSQHESQQVRDVLAIGHPLFSLSCGRDVSARSRRACRAAAHGFLDRVPPLESTVLTRGLPSSADRCLCGWREPLIGR